MKKTFFVGVLFAAAIGASLFAQEAFLITAPAGWEKKSSAALAQYQKGTGSFIITVDTMPKEANTPDKYVEFVKGKLESSLGKCTFEPVISGKKSSLDTRQLLFAVTMSGMKMKYDTLYVFHDGKAYTLTSGNLDISIDASYQKDIQAFFSSFSLKGVS